MPVLPIRELSKEQCESMATKIFGWVLCTAKSNTSLRGYTEIQYSRSHTDGFPLLDKEESRNNLNLT